MLWASRIFIKMTHLRLKQLTVTLIYEVLQKHFKLKSLSRLSRFRSLYRKIIPMLEVQMRELKPVFWGCSEWIITVNQTFKKTCFLKQIGHFAGISKLFEMQNNSSKTITSNKRKYIYICQGLNFHKKKKK